MYSHVYSLDLHNVIMIMDRSVYLYQAEAPICFLVTVCSEPYHPYNNVGVVNFMLILARTTVLYETEFLTNRHMHIKPTVSMVSKKSTFIL